VQYLNKFFRCSLWSGSIVPPRIWR
jgi:hypothetical protein